MPLYASMNNPLSEGDATLSNESSGDEGGEEESGKRPPQLSPSHLGKTLSVGN